MAVNGLATSILAGYAAALLILLQLGFDAGVLCLLAVSVLTVTCLPLVYLHRLELYEPLWMVILVTGIGVTGKAFYLIFGPDQRVDFLLLGKEPGDLHLAAMVVALSLLGLSVGYLAGDWRWRLPGLRWLVRRD